MTLTSYATIEEYKAYWENRGVDKSCQDNDTITARLNNATEYIDLSYNFKGVPTDEDQELDWPRQGATDKNGYAIDSDEIPQAVINSTCYLAGQGDNLDSIYSNVKSDRFGPVAITYNDTAASQTYTRVDKYLVGLYVSGNEIIRVN